MKRLFFLALAGSTAYGVFKGFDFLVAHIQWVGGVALLVGSLGFSKHMATLDQRKQFDPSAEFDRGAAEQGRGRTNPGDTQHAR